MPGPGMAAIFGPGGPIILPWTVRGDRFRGGTVHGVTGPSAARGGPGMAAIIGSGGPITPLWTVQVDRF